MEHSERLKGMVGKIRGLLAAPSKIQEGRDAEYDQVATEVANLFEADPLGFDDKVKGKFKKGTAHSPFKRAKKLGPTKVKGVKGRVHTKKGYWSCRGMGPYRQMCKGSDGERKLVVINRAYKKRYNAGYRKWRASASKFKKGVWKKGK